MSEFTPRSSAIWSSMDYVGNYRPLTKRRYFGGTLVHDKRLNVKKCEMGTFLPPLLNISPTRKSLIYFKKQLGFCFEFDCKPQVVLENIFLLLAVICLFFLTSS